VLIETHVRDREAKSIAGPRALGRLAIVIYAGCKSVRPPRHRVDRRNLRFRTISQGMSPPDRCTDITEMAKGCCLSMAGPAKCPQGKERCKSSAMSPHGNCESFESCDCLNSRNARWSALASASAGPYKCGMACGEGRWPIRPAVNVHPWSERVRGNDGGGSQ